MNAEVLSCVGPCSSSNGVAVGRRRGGRGRGGRGREQAVAQAFTPAAVKGSIPAVPLECGEEELAGCWRGGSSGAGSAGCRAGRAEAPAVPAAAQRPPKGVVVLAIGLPGSGKSSWFKRHNVVPLSSDMVRTLLFDDVREQRFQDLVFSNLRSMLKARLIAKRPMNYVDATNLTPQERQHWIKLAKDYNYEVHAIFFDVPLEVCIERHQRRDRCPRRRNAPHGRQTKAARLRRRLRQNHRGASEEEGRRVCRSSIGITSTLSDTAASL
jgi:predicted kinase